jgi:transposase
MTRPVTEIHRARILALSAAGMRQQDIAKSLHLCKVTVGNWQRKLGCSPNRRAHERLPVETEKTIVKLLRAGHGASYIAKHLVVSMAAVYKLKRRFHIERKPGQAGFRYHKTILELRSIRKRLRESEKTIAKEFGVSRRWLSGFRNSWWGGK